MLRTRVLLAGACALTACASFSPEVGPLRTSLADASSFADASSLADASSMGDGASGPDGSVHADAGGVDAQPPEAGPQVWTVDVGANGTHTFAPPALTIRVGDTVHWVWQASGHTVTSGTGGAADGRFCSPADTQCDNPQTSNAGDTYDHVFTAAGAFPYFCTQHPGMTGSVTVQ